MSVDRTFINTRLESKTKYENRNNNYLDKRYKQSHTIIQPMDNNFINFKDINTSYTEYKKQDVTNILEQQFTEKKNLYSNNDLEQDNIHPNNPIQFKNDILKYNILENNNILENKATINYLNNISQETDNNINYNNDELNSNNKLESNNNINYNKELKSDNNVNSNNKLNSNNNNKVNFNKKLESDNNINSNNKLNSNKIVESDKIHFNNKLESVNNINLNNKLNSKNNINSNKIIEYDKIHFNKEFDSDTNKYESNEINSNKEFKSNNISKLGLNQNNFSLKSNITNLEKKENNNNLKNIIYKVLVKRNIKVSWELIDKYFLRYNITKDSPKKVLNQMINDIKNETNIKSTTSIYKPKNIELTELIYIDSNDRDIEKWKHPNHFSIDLTAINNFTNILSIQLISATFPKKINNTENIDDFPYIILEIEELGSNYKSLNKNINKAFALLTFDIDLGKYKKLLNKSNVEYKKNFIPSISISELNIKIKNPNGKLLNFKSIKNTTNPNIKAGKLIKEPNNINNDPNNINNSHDNINDSPNNINDEPDKLIYNPNNINDEPDKLIYNLNNINDSLNNLNDEPDNFMSINFIFEIKYKKYANTLQLFN